MNEKVLGELRKELLSIYGEASAFNFLEGTNEETIAAKDTGKIIKERAFTCLKLLKILREDR